MLTKSGQLKKLTYKPKNVQNFFELHLNIQMKFYRFNN